MDQRCERCLKALPTQHVGSLLCGPCRREVGVRDAYVASRPVVPPEPRTEAAVLDARPR